MTSGRCEVLVVGCGPAGAAAAATLARARVECVVLDRAAFPRDKTCGDALSNDGVEILAQLGAAAEVLDGPHAKVRRARALLPDLSVVARDYDPPGIIVPRRSLDDALRRAAEAAGARVIQGQLVRELVVEDGRVVGARGPELDWRADLVISADGHGSLARAVLGHPKPAQRYLAVARTAYCEGLRYDAGPETADHYFEHDLPCGYAWVFPSVEGRANVGVYQRGDRFSKGAGALDSSLDRFIARHPERFADARQVGARRSWPLPLAPAPWQLSAPGLLAVGDAANLIDPLSGEGIWQALRSGQLAAQLRVEHGRDAGPELGRAYERACEAQINHASRKRARIQEAMALLVASRLYRLAPVRWALSWGYGRQSLEATKVL